MSIVKDLLDEKGRAVYSVTTDTNVYEAVAVMADKNVGALIVTSGDSKMAGIVSERDYARKVILDKKGSNDTLVSEIMTPDVIFVREDTLLERCMSLMSQKKIRHLPVINNAGPIGMITVGDIMKTIIKEQSMTIEELEGFIYEDQGGEG
jgi:CBS domain-containing protein